VPRSAPLAESGGGSGGDPPVKKPSKVNLQGQGWLFSGNHWNFDVISNDNEPENRLPGPVSLAGVGKNMFLERNFVRYGKHICHASESFFVVG
jgi:hypothetical protein